MSIGAAAIGVSAIGASGQSIGFASGSAVSAINLFITRAKGYAGDEAGLPLDEALNEGCYTATIQDIQTSLLLYKKLTATVSTDTLEVKHVCQLHQF